MRILTCLLTVLLLAGCAGNQSDDAAGDAVRSDVSAEASATVKDGVQTVSIEAGPEGFSPATVKLTPGIPARLVFRRTTDAECLHHVSVPEYGVENTPLPMHEDVAVEFTPEAEGVFTFVCGMGMQRGTLVVSA